MTLLFRKHSTETLLPSCHQHFECNQSLTIPADTLFRSACSSLCDIPSAVSPFKMTACLKSRSSADTNAWTLAHELNASNNVHALLLIIL